ncbi:MAG: hypothetical protein ACXABN_19295 [Candidatus Thorarchaeota archaeon]|jgi:hypothetical protein
MVEPSLRTILAWAGEVFPDEKRHPYVVDNEDWDTLVPVLVNLEQLIDEWAVVEDKERFMEWKHTMKVVMEILYVMGVERGEKYRSD